MENRPIIAVIDGLGGGIGCQLCARIRQAFGQRVEILALGTNSTATEKMIKAGADRGASGENVMQVSIGLAQFILGPIGIVLPDSLMGEITPTMAQSIMRASGKKILLPVSQPHFALAGVSPVPLSKLIEEAVNLLVSELDESLANKPEKQ
ncbi:MAG TPA: DUF3842 family protein [Rectinema sp.]|nr:DUF3842 family protein [Rectinema sp.]HRU78615.1 DUF3842 family protein [Rectinema sp.]